MGWINDMWSRKTARPEMNFNIGGEPEDIRKALEQSRNEAGQQPKDPDEPVFLTDPQFEALKVIRGYPKHYLGSRTASESSWAFRYATTTMGFNPFDYAQPLPGSDRETMFWQLHQPFKINGHTLSHFLTCVYGSGDNHLASNVFPADLTGNIDVDHPAIDSDPMESSVRKHNHSNHELAHLEAFKNFIQGTRGLLVPEEGR